MKDKVYKSKFGWTLFLFMTALFVIITWLSYDQEKSMMGSMVLLLTGLGTLGLFTLLSLGTSYTISATELHIKSFPFYNRRLAIDRIKKVKVSRNLISSPAPSLDRIEIYFDSYESIVISPKDKVMFMDHLKRLNPAIELVKSH